MAISQQIEIDLKQSLLAGDKQRTQALKTIKSSMQYEAVALGVQDKGLSEEQAQAVLSREAKKRSEAAELYKQAGANDRAEAEVFERSIIDSYLPTQLSEDEIKSAVEVEIAKLDQPQTSDMGKIIGAVRAKLGVTADGAIIARLVKEKLAGS